MEPSADPYFVSDAEIMRRIGKNIRNVRLDSDVTRDGLQIQTGVHKKTIGDAENGKNVTVATLIAILRGLNMLDRLDRLIMDEGVGPLMIARSFGKVPQRATGKR